MLNEIEKELTEANFVEILLHETSDVSNFAQRSTVFRYVTKDCAVKEQFIGFTDVSGDRTAEALSEYVFKCIETWKCKNKLIARTYDGAATMAGESIRLQAKVRAKHEWAIFVYCCAYVLNLVLSQACCARKECKIFFNTINGLGTFLPNLPNEPMR